MHATPIPCVPCERCGYCHIHWLSTAAVPSNGYIHAAPHIPEWRRRLIAKDMTGKMA